MYTVLRGVIMYVEKKEGCTSDRHILCISLLEGKRLFTLLTMGALVFTFYMKLIDRTSFLLAFYFLDYDDYIFPSVELH